MKEIVSVWVGANRDDPVWAEQKKTENNRNRGRREESGNTLRLPPPKFRAKVVVATGM